MSEIHLRLPAKTQYGYVEIKATPEELGLKDVSDTYALGVLYASVQASFREGEAKGLKLASGTPVPPSRPVRDVFKVGDTVEVGGTTFTKHSESPFKVPPTIDYDALEEEEAARLLKEELGGVEIDEFQHRHEDAPPWQKPVASKPKPWETGAAAAKAAAIEDLFG